jgi:hypothetical protein
MKGMLQKVRLTVVFLVCQRECFIYKTFGDLQLRGQLLHIVFVIILANIAALDIEEAALSEVNINARQMLPESAQDVYSAMLEYQLGVLVEEVLKLYLIKPGIQNGSPCGVAFTVSGTGPTGMPFFCCHLFIAFNPSSILIASAMVRMCVMPNLFFIHGKKPSRTFQTMSADTRLIWARICGDARSTMFGALGLRMLLFHLGRLADPRELLTSKPRVLNSLIRSSAWE